VLVDSTGT